MSRSSHVGWGPKNSFFHSVFQSSDEAGVSANIFKAKFFETGSQPCTELICLNICQVHSLNFRPSAC